ncbi:MAG: DUF5011 domain-containing protein [Lachnospiraceae bacterium]|nr:DUF5011 domain-containing protein [Lachnospiraceae bacterium]
MSSIRLKKNVEAAKKKSVIVISVITAVLLVITLLSYLVTDRKAPVFDFSSAAVSFDFDGYTPIPDSELLAGITATDNKDGDLTDRIVVKSVHYNEQYSVTVTYLCRDNSGNLATKQVMYGLNNSVIDVAEETTTTESKPAVIIDVPTEPVSEESSGDSSETPEESENSETEPVTEEPTTAEPTTEEPTTAEPTTEEPTTPEPTTPEPTTEEPTTEEPTTPEPTTETPTEPPTTVAPTTQAPTEPSPEGYPVIVLTMSEAHLAVGEPYYWKNYIADMYDDKDSLSFLYQNIYIENFNVDTNVPGTYHLIYHVTDSDGHMSPGTPLTLIVG